MRRYLSVVLVIAMALSMAFSASAEGETITWLVRQSEPANVDSVMEEVNRIVGDNLGATLDVRFIDPGDYTDKLNMKMAASEEFDLVFICNWVNPTYTLTVGKGALLPLDQYMNDEVMPTIMADMPALVWEGVKVNGSVYGIPNLQVMYDEPGLWFNKEVADAAGVTDMMYALAEETATADDLDAIFAKVQEYDPNIVCTLTNYDTIHQDRLAYASVGVDDFTYDVAAGKVILSNDKPDRMAVWQRARRWYEAGYLPTDASTTTMEQQLRSTGNLFARYERQKPGGKAELQAAYPDFENDTISTGTRLMATGGITSTLTGVSVTSKNPELAVRFYDLLFADKVLYNLLVFGIEGQDYTMVDETHLEQIADAYQGTAWMMGNQFNAILKVGQENGVWEETIEGNATAEVDALVGFVVDRTPVETELAAIRAISLEYGTILSYGLTADIQGTYEEMHAKIEAAGMQTVIDELQSQVDAFLAAK